MNFFKKWVFASVAAVAIAAPAQADTTYNIASLADFTGPYADVMKDMAGARHAVVAWWNAEVGKELGVTLTIKDYDHRYDAAQVASLWPGIKAEISPIFALGLGGPDATALAGRLPSDGIPMIMSTAGYGFSWNPDPWVFNPRATYPHEAIAFFEWYKQENSIEGPLKIAVISSEASPAYVDISRGIEKYADNHKDQIEVIETIYTEVQPTDLTTQINRVLRAGAQLISIKTNTAAVVAVKRALQALGRTDVPIVMSSHNGITASASAIGDLLELEGDFEVYGMAAPTDEDTAPKQFYDKLKAEYGMQGGWTIPTIMGLNQAIVGVRGLEAAIEKVGAAKVTGTDLREALLSTTITSDQTFGILPDLTYTSEAPFPTTGITVNISTVKDGKYTIAASNVPVPTVEKW